MVKKRIFCIITVVCIITCTSLSIFANGVVEEGNNTSTTETQSYTNTGNGISVMSTVPDYVNPAVSITDWSYYTYSTVIDTTLLKDTTNMQYITGKQYHQTYDSVYVSGSQTPDFNKAFRDTWSVTATMNVNRITYMKNYAYEASTSPYFDGKRIAQEVTIVPESQTQYIKVDYLETFLGDVINANISGSLDFESTTFSCEVTWLWRDTISNDINIEDMSFTENTVRKLKESIESAMSLLPNVEAYDIIGISNYKVSHEGRMKYQENIGYSGYFMIARPITQLDTFNSYDLIYQATGNSKVGSTNTVIEYVNEINIDTVVESIKNALSVDLFGTISFLDILTVIVCIGLTMWLLKVFAGG